MLQFEVLDNKDVETMLLVNSSSFPGIAIDMKWEILLPGESTPRIVPSLLGLTVVTAPLLNIVCVDCTVNPVPDGLYEITLREGLAPNITRLTKYHLRTNEFEQKYRELLVKIEFSEYRVREDNIIKQHCAEMDLLLAAAKAHVELGHVVTGVQVFEKAQREMNRLIKRINDC